MKSLRVLSIFNRYLQYGGEETMARKMAQVLSREAEVTEYTYSTEKWLREGRFSAPFRGLNNRHIARQLRSFQENEQFDFWLVHNIFPAMSPAVYKEARCLGVPVIHILHNYRFGCLNGLLFRDGQECYSCRSGNFFPGIKKRCWRGGFAASVYAACFQTLSRHSGIMEYASRFLALSKKQKELLVGIGIPEPKIDVLPLFVETHSLPYTPPSEDGDILYVGRLTPEKGLMPVCQAWARLKTNRRLVIVGDGPQREELEGWVNGNGLKNIVFKGFVPIEEQGSFWDSAAAFIAPFTWHEPGSTVILEALGRGRPVIAYNKGAACDHLENPAHGWLMDSQEPDVLYETLSTVLNTDEKQLIFMGKQAREFIRTQRSPETWLSGFLEIAERCLSGKER